MLNGINKRFEEFWFTRLIQIGQNAIKPQPGSIRHVVSADLTVHHQRAPQSVRLILCETELIVLTSKSRIMQQTACFTLTNGILQHVCKCLLHSHKEIPPEVKSSVMKS